MMMNIILRRAVSSSVSSSSTLTPILSTSFRTWTRTFATESSTDAVVEGEVISSSSSNDTATSTSSTDTPPSRPNRRGGRTMLNAAGDEVPLDDRVTVFRNHSFQTWFRDRESQYESREPTVREAEAFIRDALGVTRPTDLTMHAPKPEKTGLKYEYDEKLVKSAAQVTREASNKHTFFMNSRKLFREKMTDVRKLYQSEFQTAKRLHLAALEAKWALQKQEAAERKKIKAVSEVGGKLRHHQRVQRIVARRALWRKIRRDNRLNKEMKLRREKTTQANFLLRERAEHWLQDSSDVLHPTSGGQPIDASLFQREDSVNGFWPLHPIDETKVYQLEMSQGLIPKR